MDLMQTLREQAAAKPMRVAFPEGENETMMQAVAKIAAEHLAECVLVGAGGTLKELRRHPQLEWRRRWPFGFWRFCRVR